MYELTEQLIRISCMPEREAKFMLWFINLDEDTQIGWLNHWRYCIGPFGPLLLAIDEHYEIT